MHADDPKDYLHPDQILLSDCQLVLLVFFTGTDQRVDISEGTILDNEVHALSVLELIVQFDLVLGGVLKHLELIGYHLHLPILSALGFIDPFHAKYVPIVLTLHQKDLRKGPLS